LTGAGAWINLSWNIACFYVTFCFFSASTFEAKRLILISGDNHDFMETHYTACSGGVHDVLRRGADQGGQICFD
jgi:hypothetical protein